MFKSSVLSLVTILGASAGLVMGSAAGAQEALVESAREAAAKTAAKAAATKEAQSKEKAQWVKASIEIKAPREVVWQAVHDERKHDPDLAYSKIVVPGEHEYVLEQKMVLIPVFGSAVCEMQNKEIPLERIDYKLIKSDRFKQMEGSWVLTPSTDGKSTTLHLSTNLDLGIPVPRSVVNGFTAKKLAKRLKNVKAAAETLNAKLALAKKTNPQ